MSLAANSPAHFAAPVAGAASGLFHAYWGQQGPAKLAEYCDTGINYVTLAFLNMAPENDRSGAGYPGINFSRFCSGETFKPSPDANNTQLYHCESLKNDIRTCQEKKVKVLLGIGGLLHKPSSPSDLSGDYEVKTEESGRAFAKFLHEAFGDFDGESKTPRPFDSGKQKTKLDGFEFILNAKLPNAPYIAMANELRELNSKYMIAAGPQCPTSDDLFNMKGLVHEAKLDTLFVQFYNNPGCDAKDDGKPDDHFNFDNWEKVVAESKQSKDAKLFIGLPATPTIGGYVGPDKVKELVCTYKDSKNWGGVSLWDAHFGLEKPKDGGKSFFENVVDALHGQCPTSSAPKGKGEGKPQPGAPSSTSCVPKPTGKANTPDAKGASKPADKNNGLDGKDGSKHAEGAVRIHKEQHFEQHIEKYKKVIYSTKVETITSCPPSVTDCKDTQVVTKVIPVATTVPPPAPMMTSTVYTTNVYTVTSCPPAVVDCKTGKVVTETKSLYVTTCPVTQTAPPAAPTADVKTRTKVVTITSCPPEVIDCTTGKVSTQTVIEPCTSKLKPVHPTPAPAPNPVMPTKKPADGQPEPTRVPPPDRKPVGPVGPVAPAEDKKTTPVGPVVPGEKKVPAGPPGNQTQPIRAGASRLMMGLGGLMAAVAVQAVSFMV